MSITMTLIGYVGQDPVQRTVNTANGQQLVTNFSVASNNPRQPGAAATWYRVTVWGPYGNSIMDHVSKGQHVTVIADDLRMNLYEARNGETQASLEVRAVSVNFDPRPALRMSDEELDKVMALMRANSDKQESTPRSGSRRGNGSTSRSRSTSSTNSTSRRSSRSRQPAANIVGADFTPPPDANAEIPF